MFAGFEFVDSIFYPQFINELRWFGGCIMGCDGSKVFKQALTIYSQQLQNVCFIMGLFFEFFIYAGQKYSPLPSPCSFVQWLDPCTHK